MAHRTQYRLVLVAENDIDPRREETLWESSTVSVEEATIIRSAVRYLVQTLFDFHALRASAGRDRLLSMVSRRSALADFANIPRPGEYVTPVIRVTPELPRMARVRAKAHRRPVLTAEQEAADEREQGGIAADVEGVLP